MDNLELAPMFAKNSYVMVEHGNKEKRIKKINDKIKKTGYVVDAKNSNRDITTYINDANKSAFIAHRGTDTSGKKTKQDVTADLLYSVGLQNHSKEFKKRANRTNSIVKSIPEDYKINLSGHSYGGASVHDTLQKKNNVLNRIDKAYTFNGLNTPFEKDVSKSKAKKLDEKIINYRTHNDLVSANGYKHGVNYSVAQIEHALPKTVPAHLQNTFDKVEQLHAHSLDNFTDANIES